MVVVGAGVGLVHDFGVAAFKCGEGELVAVGDFDGFGEAEFV